MHIRDLTLVMDAQAVTAVLSESTSTDLFSLQCQLERWLRLIERELISRYPATAPQEPV